PKDGATSEELWAAAIDRLLALEVPGSHDVRVADPSTVRLWTLAERFARMRRMLVATGEPGVGRETFARTVRALGAPGAPFVAHGAGRFDGGRWADDVAGARGGALPLRHREISPASERSAFLTARQFLPSANALSAGEFSSLGSEVFIPSLRDRPADVL